MKTIFNIDKIKICLNQPEGFFEQLYSNLINDSSSNRILQYDGFFLSFVGEDAVNDKDLTASLYTQEEKPFELGVFTFNKSAKYGKKCFFTYSTKSLYETSGYVYQGKGKFSKYNYFNYPFYAFNELGLVFNNITTLEVALDTEASVISKIQYVVSHPEAFDMILLWKKVTNPDEILDGYWEYFQRSRNRRATRPTLYIHNSIYESGNNKSLKVYDKARELAQSRPDKEDIIRAWNDMGKNIQRLEVSVENKQFKRFFEDMCRLYPDRWYSPERMKEKSVEERKEEYRYELEHFFFDLGMEEKLRKELFEYFSYRLLHFKVRSHDKTQFTISDLSVIPMSVLRRETEGRKRQK